MHADTDIDNSSTLADAGAVAGDVAFGPTGIAGTLLGLGAVLADVADIRAVVALRALDTITRQVAYTTTSVASLRPAESTESSSSSPSSSTPSPSTGALRGLGARTSNMSYFATAIALGPRGSSSSSGVTTATASSSCIGAVPGDMTFETALVARFGLRFHGAISGDMTLKAAVVTGGRASFGASCCLMAEAATIKTSASTRHLFGGCYLFCERF